MNEEYESLKESLIAIAGELFRFQRVFLKAISKLDAEEQSKYASQFAWFSKRVTKALDKAGLRLVTADGQLYDPGMAVIPLNLEEFKTDDILYVAQTVEPIIMQEGSVIKTGTVILGRKDP
ncbi:MAG: hypothetical protein ACI3V2_04315 [Faecousia sp.]